MLTVCTIIVWQSVVIVVVLLVVVSTFSLCCAVGSLLHHIRSLALWSGAHSEWKQQHKKNEKKAKAIPCMRMVLWSRCCMCVCVCQNNNDNSRKSMSGEWNECGCEPCDDDDDNDDDGVFFFLIYWFEYTKIRNSNNVYVLTNFKLFQFLCWPNVNSYGSLGWWMLELISTSNW